MEILAQEIRINGVTMTLRRGDEAGMVDVLCNEEGSDGCETFGMDDQFENQLVAARAVALGFYGQDRKGRPQCTNSEVHEILNAMKQVAGV